jgi:osmotically inducible protein OsmC
MAVGAALSQAGFTPNDLSTDATLDLDIQTLTITGIHLEFTGSAIDGVSAEKFKEIAEGAKANCIISRALSVPITMNVQYV